jgi:hypothetical protein
MDSEFNSVHFGIEINECLTSLRPKKFTCITFRDTRHARHERLN